MSDEQKQEMEMSKENDLQKQCDEYLAGWKRALADYDNLKKDLAREKSAMRQAAAVDAVRSLLPVMDNFDAAVKYAPDGLDDKAKNWITGVMHVRTQLEDVLRGLGAEPYGSEGEPFDPNVHDAAGERMDAEKKDHAILEVVQRGWKVGGQVVRPAKVIVNKQT